MLAYLNLSMTAVTDDGLKYLKKLTNLTVLFLNATQVTNQGIAELKQALPKCKIIH